MSDMACGCLPVVAEPETLEAIRREIAWKREADNAFADLVVIMDPWVYLCVIEWVRSEIVPDSDGHFILNVLSVPVYPGDTGDEPYVLTHRAG